MKNISTLILAFIVAVAASYAMLKFSGGPTETRSTSQSVYDRVMDSGTIRCGYFVEPPFTMMNENTGEVSGIAPDLIHEIANDLNLKVEWAEQISFATFPQDLNNARYDLVCGGIFVLPRGGVMDYSQAFAYAPVYGYVRQGDARFSGAYSNIDWTKMTISGLEGEGATTAARKILSQAQFNILPQLSNISEMLLQVSSNKSDIGFVMPTVFADFNANNPGLLEPSGLKDPLYVYSVTFGLPRGEHEFKTLINNAIEQYTTSGELKRILDKHDPNAYFKRPKSF